MQLIPGRISVETVCQKVHAILDRQKTAWHHIYATGSGHTIVQIFDPGGIAAGNIEFHYAIIVIGQTGNLTRTHGIVNAVYRNHSLCLSAADRRSYRNQCLHCHFFFRRNHSILSFKQYPFGKSCNSRHIDMVVFKPDGFLRLKFKCPHTSYTNESESVASTYLTVRYMIGRSPLFEKFITPRIG